MFFTRFAPKNARNAYRWDARAGWLTGTYGGMTTAFFAVIARRDLHASALAITLLIAAPFLGQILGVYSAWHMQNRAKRPYMYWLAVIARGVLLFLAFATKAPLFITLVIVSQIIGNLSLPAYASIMKDAYPDAHRGRLMGMVRIGLTCSAMVAGLVTGRLMESGIPLSWVLLLGAGVALLIAHEIPHRWWRAITAAGILLLAYLAAPALGHPIGYQLLFPVAALLGIFAAWVFNHVPGGEVHADAPDKQFHLLEGIATLVHDRRFGLYSLAFMIFGFGNLLQGPLITLFQVDVLHITNHWVGQLALVSYGVSMIGYLMWGRFMDRHSPFPTVIACFVMCGLAPIVYALSHQLPTLIIATTLLALGNSGMDLTWLTAVMLFADRDGVPLYASLHNFLVGVRGFLAPFAGAWMLGFLSLRHCFYVASCIMWTGTLLMTAITWLVLLPALRARQRQPAKRSIPVR